MSNPFKAGDKILVKPSDLPCIMICRDTTEDKPYTVTRVGDDTELGGDARSVYFLDDVGDVVGIPHWDAELVTLQ